MDMGERIKQKRKQMRLTQGELSSLVDVSPITVFRWEQGERSPRAEELQKLAEVLNTSVGYFMGFDDKTNTPTPTPDLVTSAPDKKEEDNHMQSQIKTEDKGIFRYTFENGEKLELPAMPEFTGLFKEMVAQRLLNSHAYAASPA